MFYIYQIESWLFKYVKLNTSLYFKHKFCASKDLFTID